MGQKNPPKLKTSIAAAPQRTNLSFSKRETGFFVSFYPNVTDVFDLYCPSIADVPFFSFRNKSHFADIPQKKNNFKRNLSFRRGKIQLKLKRNADT